MEGENMSDRELLLAKSSSLSKEDWYKQRSLRQSLSDDLKKVAAIQGVKNSEEFGQFLDKLNYEQRVNLVYPES